MKKQKSQNLQTAAIIALQEALGGVVQLHAMHRVSGGDINQAAALTTDRGVFFVKWNEHPFPDLFEREFEGLVALAESDTTLVIPRPVCWRAPSQKNSGFLIIDYLEPGQRRRDFDELLGRGLATLHKKTRQSFGFHHDNYCGATPQPNPWTRDWVEFYREHRLRFQLNRAIEARGVSASDRVIFDRLLDRLDEFLAPCDGPPSLLHGDLWSGNVHTTPSGHPALIDPAAYHGHREAELGMMTLFGGFSACVFDAYQEAWPLEPGWRDRASLYELYHVLNHYNLFGGHYGAQAVAMARRWV